VALVIAQVTIPFQNSNKYSMSMAEGMTESDSDSDSAASSDSVVRSTIKCLKYNNTIPKIKYLMSMVVTQLDSAHWMSDSKQALLLVLLQLVA